MNLTKACKRLHLDEDEAKEMIVAHHELESMLSKKEIKKVKFIDLPLRNIQWIKKVAKELKISEDAVIGGLLEFHLLSLNKK